MGKQLTSSLTEPVTSVVSTVLSTQATATPVPGVLVGTTPQHHSVVHLLPENVSNENLQLQPVGFPFIRNNVYNNGLTLNTPKHNLYHKHQSSHNKYHSNFLNINNHHNSNHKYHTNFQTVESTHYVVPKKSFPNQVNHPTFYATNPISKSLPLFQLNSHNQPRVNFPVFQNSVIVKSLPITTDSTVKKIPIATSITTPSNSKSLSFAPSPTPTVLSSPSPILSSSQSPLPKLSFSPSPSSILASSPSPKLWP